MSYKENRLFSIPYSGKNDYNEYLNMIQEYKNHIHSIFFGLSELEDHVSMQNITKHTDYTDEERQNIYNFLEKTKGIYKRIVTYNTMIQAQEDIVILRYFENYIYPIIEKYSIDGFILTNFNLARKLHKDFPKLEIHTSCNGLQWTIRQMEMWKEHAGAVLFNPPREAARTPSLLKEFHSAGFPLKVLVNEACVYGCVHSIHHACTISLSQDGCHDCNLSDIGNMLRTNLFLPKWLDDIDEYVHVYKLAGRGNPISKLKKTFDAYILQKPFKYINDYAAIGSSNYIKILERKGILIPEKLIPNKLKYCESKYCDKTCFDCRKIIQAIL